MGAPTRGALFPRRVDHPRPFRPVNPAVPQMRKWLPVALIGLAVLWFTLTNVGSITALNNLTDTPITALARDGTRVPVQPSGRKSEPDKAQGIGGHGVMFGLALTFQLPDSTLVTCIQRFSWLTCSDGWQPMRQPGP